MKLSRKKIPFRNLVLGSGEVYVEAMTKTITRDFERTLNQVKSLHKKGARIIRVGVPTMEDAFSLINIKKHFPEANLMADIHFDHRIALKVLEGGVESIRINPGNFPPNHLDELVSALKETGALVRVGVNEGSYDEKRYGELSPEGLYRMTEEAVEQITRRGYEKILVSAKSADPITNYETNKLVYERLPYPLHIGITESGPIPEGVVKSSIGLSMLLKEGIGDTLRVSLTASPEIEVETGYMILQSLRKGFYFPEIVSCPTCSRLEIDVFKITEKVKSKLYELALQGKLKLPVRVSILGCVVNGIGEGKLSDFGIAGGKKHGIIFAKGKIVKNISTKEGTEKLIDELFKLMKEKGYILE